MAVYLCNYGTDSCLLHDGGSTTANRFCYGTTFCCRRAAIQSKCLRVQGNIFVSNGSPARIAREFCASDSRARLIRQSRAGLAPARNHAIDQSRGTWIAPLDADDLWHPEKIERQLRTFASGSGDVALVYCWYRMIDEDGRVTERPWGPLVEGLAFERHLKLNFGTGSTPLIRRSALGDLRYSTELSTLTEGGTEDWLLQLQLASHFEVACTRAYLAGYRARGGSMSSDRLRMARSEIRMFEIIRREMPDRSPRLVERRLACSRARHALMHMRGAPASAAAGFASALMRFPGAVLEVAADELRVRVAANARARGLRNHPSVGRPFFELSPDDA